MEQAILLVLQFAIIIFSVVIHEVSHGVVAYMLGDSTAKHMGRLTLNPLKHVDLFGFVMLPILTLLAWGFPIGAAKPVPYNPYNLRNQKYGSAIVGFAGPAANILIAITFSVAIRGLVLVGDPSTIGIIQAFQVIVFLNLMLAIFNLLPIPPLDGSKVFYVFLPYSVQRSLNDFFRQVRMLFSQYWMFAIILLFVLGGRILFLLSALIRGIVEPVFEFLVGSTLFF